MGLTGFDKMHAEFEEWQKTQEAFDCVASSDFAQTWVTAYRAGEKAERESCAAICLSKEAELDGKGEGWYEQASGAALCAEDIRKRSNVAIKARP